jgi:hypothetical protein
MNKTILTHSIEDPNTAFDCDLREKKTGMLCLACKERSYI